MEEKQIVLLKCMNAKSEYINLKKSNIPTLSDLLAFIVILF